MRRLLPTATVLLGLLIVAPAHAGPVGHAAATCGDFSTQLGAQNAADTRDPDHDGIFCEDNPCPCSSAWHAQHGGTVVHHKAKPRPKRKHHPKRHRPEFCVHTHRVVKVKLSRHKYPAIVRHVRRAIRKGYPRVMRLRRRGASHRRDRLLRGIPTRPGMDRDEYPMAFGRRTWKADVAYVPSSQNRGSGASIGDQLRRFCGGVRFRLVVVR